MAGSKPPRPAVAVVVPALNAAATIGATLEALARQDVDVPYEVVVVDDGSTDATVEVARGAPGPVTVVEQESRGAAEARNRGAAEASAPVLAFTDADCVPDVRWLAEGLRALEGGDLVQGAVGPPPGLAFGPFDRSLWVSRLSGLWESANLFVRRDLFERIGGFEGWLDHRGGRPFAEDTWFGWRARRAGARALFCERARVVHAVFPRGPREYVEERLRLQYFPAVVRQMPEFRDYVFARWFLSRRTASLWGALAGTGLAAATRSPLPLAAAGPYAWQLGTRSLRSSRREAPRVAAADLAADIVGAASLLRGSIRRRSLLL